MRLKSLLHQLLGLEYTRVVDCTLVDDGLMIDVAPTWRQPRCSNCGYTCRGHDRAKGRKWRHLDVAGMKLYLRYSTRRVDCERCGVTVEHLPWLTAVLDGRIEEHHRFLLKMQLERLEAVEKDIVPQHARGELAAHGALELVAESSATEAAARARTLRTGRCRVPAVSRPRGYRPSRHRWAAR